MKNLLTVIKSKPILLFLFLSTSTITMKAQFPSNVQMIPTKPNAVFEAEGNLNQGKKLDDLSWAWSGQNACFPSTQKDKYTGNHVFYAIQLPPHAILNVSLIPDDKNANMSLYGYQMGSTNYSLVPDLASCVSCEADHKWDRPHAGAKQDHTRSIRFNAINNPYNIVIAVAGANELTSGSFRLLFNMEGGETDTFVQKTIHVKTVNCEKGQTTKIEGNLSEGVLIHDLSWAWSSQNACFVGTQAHKFTGNHVLYTTEIPTYSVMNIKVIPANRKDNFSIYAYEIGVGSNRYVPDLPSCVTCEANFKWDRPHKNQKQNHSRSVKLNAINHPYQVVIGVVGADGLSEGDFTLEITVGDR